jgi:two-component system sensor histidine kinase DesK
VALLAFLLFLGFPARVMLASDLPAAHKALVLAALAAFVAIYLRVMLAPRSERDAVMSLAVMAILATAISLDDSAEFATLFVYCSAAAGFRLAAPHAGLGIGAAAAATALFSFANGYPPGDSVSYVLYALAVGALLRGYAELVGVNRELRTARDEIARLAVADERLRFARDLHDLLGHSLSVIALKSELAGRVLGSDAARAAEEIGDIERVSRDSLVQVRETVSGYRRMTLDAELRGAETALHAAGIELRITDPQVSLAPEVQETLAWGVREGVTNVIRHSAARHCDIRIHAGLTSAGVEITDDGTGDAPHGTGSGLAGLRERVSRRSGRLEAGARPGGGFRLSIELPLAA